MQNSLQKKNEIKIKIYFSYFYVDFKIKKKSIKLTFLYNKIYSEFVYFDVLY